MSKVFVLTTLVVLVYKLMLFPIFEILTLTAGFVVSVVTTPNSSTEHKKPTPKHHAL
jgi:hypothetical protein